MPTDCFLPERASSEPPLKRVEAKRPCPFFAVNAAIMLDQFALSDTESGRVSSLGAEGSGASFNSDVCALHELSEVSVDAERTG